MHIVDELIWERSRKLQANRVLWPVLRPLLYQVLGYRAAMNMADSVANCTGFEAFAHVSEMLKLDITTSNAHFVPRDGRLMLISNHPTGLADGIAAFDALRELRPDLIFFANADALRVVPGSKDIIIPVEWVSAKRTREKARETLIHFRRAMDEERCVVVFPSGGLAKLGMNGLIDRPWASSAASLARKFKIPIVPVHMRGRNSILYYLFSAFNTELRDITLFHELLNKKNKSFSLNFGSPIATDTLPSNTDEATQALHQMVTYDLAVTE